ncbi:MAG: hypothetical protein H6741_19775 [Alphaproteobacteria bacterium]|nr:hypothetical protein [Alphaproteobacteria bacterium]MCB9794945.1 hypothetical protein [Alphaproteobacteria bacterium]
MNDPDGRYADASTLEHVDDEGRAVPYLRHRTLPRAPAAGRSVQVRQGDRLDLIAARELGEAADAWRIADVNEAMDPGELVEAPGRTLRLPRTGGS